MESPALDREGGGGSYVELGMGCKVDLFHEKISTKFAYNIKTLQSKFRNQQLLFVVFNFLLKVIFIYFFFLQ